MRIRTHVLYIHVLVILPKQAFICVSRRFLPISLIVLPCWQGYCLRKEIWCIIDNFFILLYNIRTYACNIEYNC